MHPPLNGTPPIFSSTHAPTPYYHPHPFPPVSMQPPQLISSSAHAPTTSAQAPPPPNPLFSNIVRIQRKPDSIATLFKTFYASTTVGSV